MQPLVRSPGPQRLLNAKAKLDSITTSMNEGIHSITNDKIDKLKYVAKFCTCSDHKSEAADFAYHWLASPRLVDLLDHMRWSMDTAKWNCLALGNLGCTSTANCFNSTELHSKICRLINRIAVGAGAKESLQQLAGHWFCGKHHGDGKSLNRLFDKLWKKCRLYLETIGRAPHRRRTSDLQATESLADSNMDSSQAGRSPDTSLFSDSSELIDLPMVGNVELMSKPLQTLQPNTECDSGEQIDESSPWSDPSICEESGDDNIPEKPILDSIQGTPLSSDEAPCDEAPYDELLDCQSPSDHPPSSVQNDVDEKQSSRVPGTFPVETVRVGEDPELDAISSGGEPQPSNDSQAPSTTMYPAFEHCKFADFRLVCDELFTRLKAGLPPPNGKSNDGHIYVHQSLRSPGHVKIGLTEKRVRKRKETIERCAGDLLPIGTEHHICKVPHRTWLEKTIHDTLAPLRRNFKCNSCKRDDGITPTEHREWFEGDAKKIADHVQRWRQWMRSHPYDRNGKLYPRWQRRVDFFQEDDERYDYLLSEPCPIRAWSIFLAPPWRIWIHMVVYDVFLRERGEVKSRWELMQNSHEQFICTIIAWSAIVTTLLLYAGYQWISNLMALPLIFFIVLCTLIWRT
ncbi:MAG: hypothetical protein Q9169_002730 [Polycauliona sp. 2 TL-2023]